MTPPARWGRRPVANAARVGLLFAAYAAATFVLFRQDFIGDRTFFDFGDSSLQSYPWLVGIARAARHGQLMLWEFGSQAGTSFAGELQPAPFYPVTWLLGLLGLDGLPLCNAFVLLHFALAATTMHLLARGEGLSRPAALVAAALFAFCGYLPFQANAQPNIFASLCWLPLVVLLARRGFGARCWAGGVVCAGLAGLAGGMQIAAGHMQPFVHGSYAVVICGLAETLRRAAGRTSANLTIRPVLLALLGQAMAVGFAAVPLELANQYLHLVFRWYAGGMSRWPHAVPPQAYADGAALTWPDFAGLFRRSTLRTIDGSLYLTTIGVLLCGAGLLGRRPFAATMAVLAVFSIALALGGQAGPLVHLFFHLPLLPQLRSPVRAVYLFSFAAALLAAIGLDAILDGVRRWLPGLVRPAALVVVALVIARVSAFDAGVGRPAANREFAPDYYDHDPALRSLVRLSNQGPLVSRVYALPRDLVPPNAGDVVPVLNVAGQRATMLVSLFDYISPGWDPVASTQLDRLGVRWVVSDHAIDGLALRAQGPGYRIYERPHALSVLWIKGPGAEDRRPVPVERARWQPDRVSFEIAPLPAGTRLVFAQPVYPGWQAWVDGRRVNADREEIFTAIVLPAGARRVSFVYRPSLLVGKLLMLCCGAILVSAVWRKEGWALPRPAKGPPLETDL